MKKTPIKQIGKIGRINAKANRRIAQMWVDMGIDRCEVCEVLHDMGLLNWQCGQSSTNAHRHGRVWYRGRPDELSDFKQVVRACIKSHDYLDNVNPKIKDEVFIKLRGKEQNENR